MKWTSILFKTEMIQALQQGRKTQTRRIVKRIPAIGVEPEEWCTRVGTDKFERMVGDYRRYCPYGIPGDRLWVKETWKLWESDSFSTHGEPLDPDVIVGPLSRFGEEYLQSRPIEYFADSGGDGPWRPSIYMPRWASRYDLEIVAVRVERVQNITEADAMAEGVTVEAGNCCAVGAFEQLWDKINAKRGYPWSLNPWVWVIEFRE
jgi:hypothetical protein